MTRYKLPEALGSAECAFHAKGHAPDCVIVELLDGPYKRLRIEIEESVLTKVPSMDEPPIGAVVLDDAGRAWQRQDGPTGEPSCWYGAGLRGHVAWDDFAPASPTPLFPDKPPEPPERPS